MQTDKVLKKKIIPGIIFILSLIISTITYGQENNVTISGTILSSEDGNPLPGVNVLIKGTTSGTITDTDGNYKLECTKGSTVSYSYIGYLTEEVIIENQSVVNISLVMDIASLSEVVVVGYGTMKKSNVTSSISKVTNDKLDQIPLARVDDALAGTMSGVQVSITNANIGASPTIRIRGTASMTTASDPLVVIDGTPVSASFLGTIDMNDVESVEVLKDASSAAIYGSRGAAGVIMITTKQGKSGTAKFNFDTYYGVKSPVDDHRGIMSLDDWVAQVGSSPQSDYAQSLGTETNWFDVMVDGGSIQSYSLSASGGNEATTYHISGGYLKDEGILLTDQLEKYNGRINLNTKVNKRIEMGFSASPSFTKVRTFPMRFHDQVRQSSWLPIYHTDITAAETGQEVGSYATETHFNNLPDAAHKINNTGDPQPYARIVERDYETKKFNLLSNGYLSISLFDGLKFRTSMAVEYATSATENRTGVLAHKSASDANTVTNSSELTHWVNENYFAYDKTFGVHEINAILGFSVEKASTYLSNLSGSGYLFDYIPTISSANTLTAGGTSKEASTLASFYGRLNYALSEKYLASVSLRGDGSSRFGADNRWGMFPAFSVGWRVNKEEFMQGIEAISELKLRASYGISGQNADTAYSHLGLLNAVSPVFNGSLEPGYAQVVIGNPELQWQKSVEFNPGIDLGLYNNRIFLSAEYYKKTSDQLLLYQPTPAITGFQNVYVNKGKVENKGVDIELTTVNISTTNFTWKSTILFSKYKNQILDLAGADSTIRSIDPKRAFEFIAIEGEPISSYWGYESTDEIDTMYLKNPLWPIGGTAQDIYVKDQNGDGEITSADKVILGDPYPDFTWSFVNTVRYKNVDFSFTLSGSHGAEIVNMDRQYIENQFAGNMDWDPAVFPADQQALVQQKIYTDAIIQDASYIALRTINLGFTIPKSLTERVGITDLRLYVAASNLLYFMSDEYNGWNPEGVNEYYNANATPPGPGSQVNPFTYGYQRGASPLAKAITFGLNLSF